MTVTVDAKRAEEADLVDKMLNKLKGAERRESSPPHEYDNNGGRKAR